MRSCEPFLRNRTDGVTEVGTIYTDDPKRTDYGPVAEVYFRDQWLYIVTDCYEGSVMLDKLAAPLLVQALQRLLSPPRDPPERTGVDQKEGG